MTFHQVREARIDNQLELEKGNSGDIAPRLQTFN